MEELKSKVTIFNEYIKRFLQVVLVTQSLRTTWKNPVEYSKNENKKVNYVFWGLSMSYIRRNL